MNIAIKTLIGAGLFSCFACNDTPNRPVETADGEEYSEPDNDEPSGLPVNAPPNETDDANANPGAAQGTSSATESIAEARCAREATCNNIGSDKKFSSNDDCMARIRDDWKDDLNSRECPGGVNQTELNECLTEIRNEECSSPFDTLSRVAACASGQICVD